MKENGHSPVLLSSKFQDPFANLPYGGLTLVPSTFVKGVTVEGYRPVGDHYEFILSIFGATRFLHVTARTRQYIKFAKILRYSELLGLHNALTQELMPYLKAEGSQMPEFPGKTWFSSGRKLAEKRVAQLKAYFSTLFSRYSAVLLYSQNLINFFEPQRIDLSIIGCKKEHAASYIRALSFLVANMSTEPDPTVPGLCDLVKHSRPTDKDFDWTSYVPFDFKYRGQLYRVDVQNLYATDSVGESDCIVSLYQTHSNACVLAVDVSCRTSLQKAKEMLGNIKLFLTEGGYAVPPFVVVGFGHDEIHREVSSGDVNSYLLELFGEHCPYRYIEVSCTRGEQVVESLEALIDNIGSVGTQLEKETPK